MVLFLFQRWGNKLKGSDSGGAVNGGSILAPKPRFLPPCPGTNKGDKNLTLALLRLGSPVYLTPTHLWCWSQHGSNHWIQECLMCSVSAGLGGLMSPPTNQKEGVVAYSSGLWKASLLTSVLLCEGGGHDLQGRQSAHWSQTTFDHSLCGGSATVPPNLITTKMKRHWRSIDLRMQYVFH